MSRSFKHTPVSKCAGGKPAKRKANKKVRRLSKENSKEAIVGKSNGYRRMYPQYDVCDYRFWGDPIGWDDKNRWERAYKRK